MRKSIEQLSQATLYKVNKEEIHASLNLIQGLLNHSQPKIAQVNNIGSIIVINDKTKILFEGMLLQEVENFLYENNLLSIFPETKDHELIIQFEQGHAKAVLQHHSDNETNTDFFYSFDFLSYDHAAGGIKGYLSIFSPDKCKLTWEDNFARSEGIYLASGRTPIKATLATQFYYSQFSEMQREYSTDSSYLIFKLSEDEFTKVEQKMLETENKCISGELKYAAHSLYAGTYNCFTSLNLLTSEIGLKEDILHYFLDNQFNHQDIAHKLALIYSRPGNMLDIIDIAKLIGKRMLQQEDDDSIPEIKYEKDYILVNCDRVRDYKMYSEKCAYDNICALKPHSYQIIENRKEVHPHPLTYNKADNSFSYTSLLIYKEDDLIKHEINQTLIFKIDADHQIID